MNIQKYIGYELAQAGLVHGAKSLSSWAGRRRAQAGGYLYKARLRGLPD